MRCSNWRAWGQGAPDPLRRVCEKYNVPVRVLSSFNDNPGTLVTKGGLRHGKGCGVRRGVRQEPGEGDRAGVPDKPGVAAKIFNTISDNNIVVDMIIQNVGEGGLTDMSFTVPKTDAKKINEVMKKIVAEIAPRALRLRRTSPRSRSSAWACVRTLAWLRRCSPPWRRKASTIMMISTSEIKISIVIDAKYTELAVRVLHETFEMDKAA